MRNANIFILSRPVQSGKTTLLQNWLKDKKNVGGILTPDENGLRKLIDLASGKKYDLQLKEDAQGLKIGRFVFDETVFQTANEALMKTIAQHDDWIIADEIGKLEIMQGKGLEPSVSRLIEHFTKHKTSTKLLLVIRDYLLDDAIDHYQLQDAKILPADFFINETLPTLNGVVLCGGESKRMKTDKAFINYYKKPQYVRVANLLHSFCDDIFLSVNAQQHERIADDFTKIIDRKLYENAGPMTGLLSVLDQQNEKALLVAGCDYPCLKRSDLLQLCNAREDGADAVCFINKEGFAEPLIAVYEPACFNILYDFYKNGNRSLQQFLKHVNTKFITAQQEENLTSFDIPEKMKAFKK